ncbi:hypothetical protein H0H92_012974 [Tricholoma furcatifolium]|nr:hypothetical protein H0H92_012974 [Tricholoma furcatifolium]
MSSSHCRCAVRGSIIRNIARPGETISSHRYQRRVGGKGANQAIAIIKAGGVADFYGSIGDDGLWVRETAAGSGLDVTGMTVANVPTGRALIQIADSGENSIILFPGANCSQSIEDNWASSGLVFPECTHLLVQNEILMESTLHALCTSNAITIYNPSPMPSPQQLCVFPWEKVDWLIVNEGEAEDLYTALSGTKLSAESPEQILSLLASLPALKTTNVICTLGSAGVLAFIPAFHREQNNKTIASPIRLPAAVLRGTTRDTTGAGDCFTGYFVQGLMGFGPHARPGHGIEVDDVVDILKVCVQAAGMCVERPGTIDSVPTMDEVKARMSEAELA